MAQLDFNPVGAPRPTVGEILPKGKYLAIISDSDVKDTKKQDGKILWLERTIQEPQAYRGRKVFQRINFRNKSAEAQRIGQEQLAGLLDALGMGDKPLTDTVHLHNKPHVISVFVEQDDAGSYEPQNEVKRCAAPNTWQAAAGAAAPAPANRPAPFYQQQPPAQQPQAPAPQPAAPAPAPAQPAEQQAQAPAEQAQPQAPAPAPALAGSVPPWMKR